MSDLGGQVATVPYSPTEPPHLSSDIRFRCRISPGNKALTNCTRQAMHGKAAGRFAAAIEAGNRGPVHVDDLAARVDAQPGAGVMEHRRRPGRIKRRFFDSVARSRLAKIRILAGIDE